MTRSSTSRLVPYLAVSTAAIFTAVADGAVVRSWGDIILPAVPLLPAAKIFAGHDHNIVLQNNGVPVAWGSNTAGISTSYASLTGMVAFAAGAVHNLAIRPNGTVTAWGSNTYGQTTVPAGLTNVIAIVAGRVHSMALKSDGTVVTWGSNDVGQRTVPVGLAGVIAISGHHAHNLALKNDGTVVAWGDNTYGQSSVPGLFGVTAIATGHDHSVALRSNGTVAAWGDNTFGQTSVPAGLSGVIAISAGGSHTLALKNDGKVVAWGGGSAVSALPTTLDGVVEISSGRTHAMARKADGSVVVWGGNDSGQAMLPGGVSSVISVAPGHLFSTVLRNDGTVFAWGYDFADRINVPAGLTGVTAISTGREHTLALKSDGTVVAWGSNHDAESGEVTVPAGLKNVVAVAAGQGHSLALKSDGTVVAWGENFKGESTVPPGLGSVVAIAGGSNHSLALKSDGTVVAWGDADGAAVPAGLNGVVRIAAGVFHSLALKSDGTVVAWGRNTLGQSTVPPGLNDVVDIEVNGFYSLALKRDGTVVGWGDNDDGFLTPPADLTNAVAVAGSETHTLSLVSSGVKVALNLNSIALSAGQGQQFTATVTGTPNLTVEWSINPSIGAISPNGLYIAPPSMSSSRLVTVTARSAADRSALARAVIHLQVSGNCLYSFSAPSLLMANGPGQGNVNVQTGTGCAWNAASSDSSWLTLTNSTGTGPGTISFAATANTNGRDRTAVIQINEQTFAVTQPGLGCVVLSQTEYTVGAAATTIRVPIFQRPDCHWRLVRTFMASWAHHQPSPVRGAGNYEVIVSIDANPANSERTGYFYVQNQEIAIIQRPAGETCAVTLDRNIATASSGGDTLGFTVRTQGDCPWTAQSSSAWVTIVGSAQGNRTRNLRLNVAANAGATRSTTVTVGPQTLTVWQARGGCDPTFNMASASIDLNGGVGAIPIGVAVPQGCQWTALSTKWWLFGVGTGINQAHVASGTNSGTIPTNVAANLDSGGFAVISPRTGSIGLGGTHVQVMQSGLPFQLFTDVPIGHPFLHHIAVMRKFSVVSGCGTAEYCPDALTTRGQMAVFVVRAVLGGDDFQFPTVPYFSDVPATHLFFKWIQKLREMEITLGCGGTQYCPDDNVTREQMAAFIIRARLAMAGGQTPLAPATPFFTDVPSSSVFFSFIQKMRQLGITTGCSSNGYCPSSPTTRGQMAVFIVRGLITP